MPGNYTTTRRVEFRDTDAAGIAHFSAFFVYMEEVEHEFLRQRGLSVLFSDRDGSLSWPRVSAHCDFQGAVRFEDVLDIALTMERLGTKSVTYSFSFMHQGREVATGRMTAVLCRLDPNGPPQAIAIPDWIPREVE